MRTAKNLACLAIAVALNACASYTDQVREVTASFRDGRYPDALQRLEKTDLKESERNRLLYYLEKGTILDHIGEKKDGRTLWMKADQLADQLYTSSLSKEAATYLFNESAQDYPGEDYEKVAIHTMLAHSFLEEGDLKGSRVEAARINSKLNEINSFYNENKNNYKEDAYARYLSAMIYESLGEQDSAIVDYKAALRLYEGDYSELFNTGVPDMMVESLYRLLLDRNRGDEARILAERYKKLARLKDSKDDFAEIAVLHEVGTINTKEANDFIVPLGGQVVRFSFPIIKIKSPSWGRTGVRIDDQPFEEASLAQNFNRIASKTLEDRRLRLLAKSAARLILKGQLTQKAEKEFGALGWLAGNIYGAVTETADTRGWTTLPASIYVTRVRVKPGSYSLNIQNNGRVSQLKKVVVKKGELRLIRDF